MKKVCNKYYLSVEGETEKWYFEHLQKLIEKNEELEYNVKLDIKVNKVITSRAKTISAPFKVNAFHICDYESDDENHKKQFDKVLKDLKSVRLLHKNIKYKLGYSNFSFELWIILHKIQQKSMVSSRKQYLTGINKAYNEKFKCLDDYKEEKNFKEKILSKINLNDVINAVNNGNEIRKINERNSKKNYRKYGQFEYYAVNPDMTINECVEKILIECEAIKKEAQNG